VVDPRGEHPQQEPSERDGKVERHQPRVFAKRLGRNGSIKYMLLHYKVYVEIWRDLGRSARLCRSAQLGRSARLGTIGRRNVQVDPLVDRYIKSALCGIGGYQASQIFIQFSHIPLTVYIVYCPRDRDTEIAGASDHRLLPDNQPRRPVNGVRTRTSCSTAGEQAATVRTTVTQLTTGQPG